MTTDRVSSMGMDVLRYRVFRIEKLEHDELTLSIDSRQYATDEHAPIPGAPPGAAVSMEGFESQGKGDVTLPGKSFVPARGKLNLRATVRAKVGGNQRGVLQREFNANVTP